MSARLAVVAWLLGLSGLGLDPAVAQPATQAAPAASAPAAGPAGRHPAVATLELVYAAKPPDRHPFSKRLAALKAAAERTSARLNEPVAGLDFSFAIDGQDGEAKSLRYDVLTATADKASVQVRFVNETPRELRYDLVLEGGRWLIDEVRRVDGKRNERWVLSRLLRRGAAGK